jgi:CheY-like chemotaxis protein
MKRLLIVDDKEENLYLMRVLLEDHGYRVDLARHGAEALIKARQTPPDLIITNLLRPVMEGFRLCLEWKRDQRLKHVPFVVYAAGSSTNAWPLSSRD